MVLEIHFVLAVKPSTRSSPPTVVASQEAGKGDEGGRKINDVNGELQTGNEIFQSGLVRSSLSGRIIRFAD